MRHVSSGKASQWGRAAVPHICHPHKFRGPPSPCIMLALICTGVVRNILGTAARRSRRCAAFAARSALAARITTATQPTRSRLHAGFRKLGLEAVHGARYPPGIRSAPWHLPLHLAAATIARSHWKPVFHPQAIRSKIQSIFRTAKHLKVRPLS